MPEPRRRQTDERRSAVRLLAFDGDDAELVRGVVAGSASARAAFYDRFVTHAERLLVRVLGAADPELDDLLHDVFLSAFATLHGLRDASALTPWMTRVTVFTARKRLRSRRRRAWLRLFASEEQAEASEPAAPELADEAREAVACVYRALEAMPADERIPLALRFIDGMELVEVAAACSVSLATIKRRLAVAEKKFRERAANHPPLHEWLEGGRS
ncbi:MAG: RNA polymerase sigma factor [Deltaproteobacteria bacterium]|nr:RNA polymerase sigma factor [Deltaproteobacteria bacterium]